MFYTNQPIKLHSKCLSILDMIQKSNNRLEDFKSRLYAYKQCENPFALVRLMYRREGLEEQINHYQAVSQRLEQYYANTFAAIVERAIIRGEKLSQTIKFTSHDC